MSHKLINHSNDLKRLWDEGYEIEFIDAFLLIHHVPYLTASKTVEYGTMVTNLDLRGNQTLRPATHVAYFIGNLPHHATGLPIDRIIIGKTPLRLHEKILANLTFSSKPNIGYYEDYYQKMFTYINILASEAKFVDSKANEKTHQVTGLEDEVSVFQYHDTNSARSFISSISAKVKELKIAIVGSGGTGSYILDFIAKTSVAEIHLFDGDIFSQHNAFRAPGAPTIEELKEHPNKVEYLARLYGRMHKHIIPHPYYLTIENTHELIGFSFVFICIDDSAAKLPVVKNLEENGVPFIDVGMGIHVVDQQLIGVLRTTMSTPKKRDHIQQKGRIPFDDGGHNEYASNIQIAELNALNAAFAVIKWKKLFGIYNDAEKEHHSTYTINENQLVNDDTEN